MVEFIFSILSMFAAGAILFIFVRALPRIETGDVVRRGVIEKWITSDLPEKVDYALNNFLVKFLRRMKIFILRIDNIVGNRLKKMRLDGAPQGKMDFKEINGESQVAETTEEETKNPA